ncbi:MAG: DNA polymerase III subunit epsilon [Candidatus Rariloculaceae bacterium]
MRQVILDTETTGLETKAGHRIIEIGCIELVNRRVTQNSFHRYINPQRAVDKGALAVHGIGDEFLVSQPLFAEVADEFLDFVDGAQLVIHNAEFDIGFINHEFSRLNEPLIDIRGRCEILDTLALARKLHPGQRNSLDALAKRYSVDISKRELHGALLDAQILADVYLAMTGGQVSLLLDGQPAEAVEVASHEFKIDPIDRDGLNLTVPRASAKAQEAHEDFLAQIEEHSGAPAVRHTRETSADNPKIK